MLSRRRFSLSMLAAATSGGAGVFPTLAAARRNAGRDGNMPTALKLKYVPKVDIATLPPALSTSPGRRGGATLEGVIRWSSQGTSADLFNLKFPLSIANEDRLNLLYPTLARAFSGAEKIGSLYLTGDPAVIYVDAAAERRGPEVLAHKSFSYNLPSAPQKVALRTPSLSQLPVVGSVYAKSGDGETPGTLVLLTPTIVNIN